MTDKSVKYEATCDECGIKTNFKRADVKIWYLNEEPYGYIECPNCNGQVYVEILPER